MKIRAEHYTELRDAIAALPADKVAAHKEGLKDDPRVKDLGKRFRWDLLYASVGSRWVCDTLYSYMNDTHTDTALRNVVAELGL